VRTGNQGGAQIEGQRFTSFLMQDRSLFDEMHLSTTPFPLQVARALSHVVQYPEDDNIIGLRVISDREYLANSSIFACFLSRRPHDVRRLWKSHGFHVSKDQRTDQYRGGLHDAHRWRIRQIPPGLLCQTDRRILKQWRKSNALAAAQRLDAAPRPPCEDTPIGINY